MKLSALLSAIGLLILALFFVLGQQRPRRVTVLPHQREGQAAETSSRLPRSIYVKAGENLQKAVDRARYGDEIVVEAGAVFQGPIILRNKGPLPSGMTDEQAYITIRSSRAGELPSGTAPYTSSEILAATNPTTGLWNLDQFPRHQFSWQSYVKPEHAPLMPKIVSAGGGAVPAVDTELGAHHYKLVGLEIRPVDENAFIYDLVRLGRGGWSDGQNTPEEVPHHFIIDRCYIHAFPNQGLKRGIALNSSDTQIINSYVSDFKVQGQDAQAICGWNGTGNYIIENCYLEAAGENFLIGGSDTALQNNVPTNTVFRRNFVSKPLAWFNSSWTVKNLFELKNARYVLVEGNLFENCWPQAQSGYALVLTPRNQDGRNNWATVEDVIVRNNIIRHVGGGIQFLRTDYINPSQTTKRITVENNLIYDTMAFPYSPNGGLEFGGFPDDFVLRHNTIVTPGRAIDANIDSSGRANNLTINDNILVNDITVNDQVQHVGGRGTYALNLAAVSWQFVGNVYVDALVEYPPGNYQVGPEWLNGPGMAYIKFVDPSGGNYRLRSDSPFKGRSTNKRDLGCNFDLLEDPTRGVVQR